MSKDINKPTSSIVDDVQAADVKASYTKNVPKKIKRIVKAYNKSKFYSPFQFSIDHVTEGENPKWADMEESVQQAVIDLSRTIENYA